MAFLDRLRLAGGTLLEHEIPSPDELRTVVGALVKGLGEAMGADDVAEFHTALMDAAVVPTNESGNVGDASGGAPASVQQVMPSADEIAAALIRAGYAPPAAAPAEPAPADPAPEQPATPEGFHGFHASEQPQGEPATPVAGQAPVVTPIEPTPVEPAPSAPQGDSAHVADPQQFTPSPLPPPREAPAIVTSDDPAPSGQEG